MDFALTGPRKAAPQALWGKEEGMVESSPKAGTEQSAIPSDVAGMAGLEPANAGVKVPCLTTWLHP